jgi:dephospho-CoA kinase
MSNWPGKFVIGLTGNIATGKSVVRKMLEHLGAYGIDADTLGHRAITKDAPGYQAVVKTFGKWILTKDGQIDRSKLGRLVFTNPEALSTLEDIVHPLVRQAVVILANRAPQKVIVIEAIKLLESELRNFCDTIWVTDTTESIRIQRLVEKRKLSYQDALERIHAQSAQEIKLKAADIVINNNKSFEDTWKQVASAWKIAVPLPSAEEEPTPTTTILDGQLSVRRAQPKDAQEIANFINQASGGRRNLNRDDIMEAFGEKAFLFLLRGTALIGLLGWQVENLVARVDDFYMRNNISLLDAMTVMMNEVEKASKELQCEAALLFLPPRLAQHQAIWNTLEYSPRTIKDLGVRAWQDAALESMAAGTVMMFKQLRVDRVLRPV